MMSQKDGPYVLFWGKTDILNLITGTYSLHTHKY